MKVISIKTFLLFYNKFTGIIIANNQTIISFFKDGYLHRKNAPAYYSLNECVEWYENGKCHREDGPATEHEGGGKGWWFKYEFWGKNDAFTVESWKEKVKELKRKEKLKIFL